MADDEWRFAVDDVDEDGIVDTVDPIEPEAIVLEHAAFVALGVLVTILVVLRLLAVI